MIKKLARKLSKRSASSSATKTKTATKAKKSTKAKTTTRKRSILKNMSQEELYSMISIKAYEIFIDRGYSHGNDQTDWYEAEKIVMSSVKK